MDSPSPLPTTEEQIRAARIGEPTIHNAPIELVRYDETWPALFEREAEKIASALGSHALMIEHVGSTSIPGLAAKPIIDVLLVVANPAEEASYLPALEAAGYVLRIREPEWHEHRMLRGADPVVNLHVHAEGSPEIGRMLLFRDWLRADDDDRRRYEDAKRELAAREWKYVQNYADAKSSIVEEIILRAAEASES